MANLSPTQFEYPPEIPRASGHVTRAYIGATMDLPHYGHVLLIQKAKEMADEVVVVLNTDDFIVRFKGHPPVMTLAERMLTVAGLKGVDFVDWNIGGEDSKPMLMKYKPDFILFGDDYKIGPYIQQIGAPIDFLKWHKMKLIQVPYTKEISTSMLIKRIKETQPQP